MLRVILDTNTLLCSLIASSSTAARVRRLMEDRRVIPLLSKPVLQEYRAVLLNTEIRKRFPQITPELVEISIRRMQFVSDYIAVPAVRFEYLRDPRDQKFIELAIDLDATHIVSSDQDLLSLPLSHGEAGKRFRQRLPRVQVLESQRFLQEYKK